MDMTLNNTITSDSEVSAAEYGMKWHKFLIYCSLWAGGILNLALGIWCMAEGMLLYGLVTAAAGVYIIAVRYMLANFKSNAFKHLLAVQLIVIAADLMFAGFDISSVASSVAVCAVNYNYYKKREKLFVN